MKGVRFPCAELKTVRDMHIDRKQCKWSGPLIRRNVYELDNVESEMEEKEEEGNVYIERERGNGRAGQERERTGQKRTRQERTKWRTWQLENGT